MPEDEFVDETGRTDGTTTNSTFGASSRRRFLTVAAATGAAATLGGTAVAQQSSDTATVTFDDQTTGGKTVTVQSTTLPEGGYVAIHDARLQEGKALESVVGVSAYLDAGTHENVEVTLFDVEGAEFEMGMLDEDQPLIAMPHRETNGNETYEFVASGGEDDGPYTADGGAVVDDAAVTVESMPMASVTFDDQTTGGQMVDIASTTLSEGGFVAIHDSSLLDGKVLESVVGVSPYLEAGTHEDVSVTLFNVNGADFDAEMMLEEDQTLIAMPHLDTNDTDTYDFVSSGGEDDGPYTADGKAVVDDAAITVEATEQPMADVCFPDQKSDGMSVMLPEATLSEGGFVAIHDSRLQDGEVFESVIGVSEYLDAGTHEDIEVDLFQGVPGGDFDKNMLDADETLVAMPHFDSNDTDTYDFITSEGQEDGPYTMDGKPVVNPGKITVEDGC
ncbi:Tat (twin-arginine translocation) pathway signal sequence [Halogranum rubrum]|uniref:Tat (Twin-arginine translocation) pathway signal sequence n=1 Tax=Halogranum rubrum TaxID=553466 RepID=A0A1I4F0R9_9EURY|nr:twin-arginine translocation signal domain-containing protein [Halogranum rubrum]SFL11514.1 Tat (twin-arginine translocation) pathway signal sequence [Halogranum rubrum]